MSTRPKPLCEPCLSGKPPDVHAPGRVVHAILHMADLPLARSLVWNVPTIGILMNVAGLFLKWRSRSARSTASQRGRQVRCNSRSQA